MKQILILFGIICMHFPSSSAANMSHSSSSDSKQPSSVEAPVSVKKDKNGEKTMFAPGMQISGTVRYLNQSLFISLPLEGDYFEVTITSESSSNVWITQSTDASDIVMPFDGDDGLYSIEISSSNGNYSGWFELY